MRVTTPAATPGDPDLLTTPEAADLLHMTPAGLGNAAIAGRVPSTKTPGGKRRYPRAPLTRMHAAAGDAAHLRGLASRGDITRAEAAELLLCAGHGLTTSEVAMMLGGAR